MAGKGFATKLNELLPKIKERRQEIEDGRRIPKDLVAEMAATGLWKLGFPTDLGGDGASIPDLMRVHEKVAAVDGSAGWIAMICGGGADVAPKMTEEGIKEVFSDPSMPTAAAIPPKGMAVPADGGFRFSGTWPFASGVTHVDWVAAGCVILYDGQPRMTPMGMPELVWGFMPVTEIEIQDTWYVNGLKGTGSNDFSGKDVFVPGAPHVPHVRPDELEPPTRHPPPRPMSRVSPRWWRTLDSGSLVERSTSSSSWPAGRCRR